jgi:threonine/homoserine/homoserine lactone efflux protein
MLEGVARSFAFGATLAAAVGPIAVLILNYGIRSGLRQAVAAGFGAALADFTYALTAFSIGSILLARFTRYEQALRVVSGLILVASGHGSRLVRYDRSIIGSISRPVTMSPVHC